jgi:hypothetical protein
MKTEIFETFYNNKQHIYIKQMSVSKHDNHGYQEHTKTHF